MPYPLHSAAARAGYPVITVPAGFVDGLPVGVSFVGRAFGEPTLIRLAYAFEQATHARRRSCRIQVREAVADEGLGTLPAPTCCANPRIGEIEEGPPCGRRLGCLKESTNCFRMNDMRMNDMRWIARRSEKGPDLKGMLFVVALLSLLPFAADGATVYSQPPSAAGGLLQSSWWDPDGSDYDQYVWDAFTLASSEAITEIAWRGGYDPSRSGSGGQVIDFKVAIYASIPAGTQPDVVSPPLVDYQTGGNAEQTTVGEVGSVQMYDYRYVLPKPFQAAAGTKYWVQIEAFQHGIPDWGMAAGTAGDGYYFRRIANVGNIFYQTALGDAAFSLLAADPPSNTPTPTDTPTPSATQTALPTSTTNPCVGDCHGDGQVTVDEIITMVNIALDTTPIAACEAGDANHDGQTTVDEIVRGVSAALNGCGG